MGRLKPIGALAGIDSAGMLEGRVKDLVAYEGLVTSRSGLLPGEMAGVANMLLGAQ